MEVHDPFDTQNEVKDALKRKEDRRYEALDRRLGRREGGRVILPKPYTDVSLRQQCLTPHETSQGEEVSPALGPVDATKNDPTPLMVEEEEEDPVSKAERIRKARRDAARKAFDDSEDFTLRYPLDADGMWEKKGNRWTDGSPIRERPPVREVIYLPQPWSFDGTSFMLGAFAGAFAWAFILAWFQGGKP